MTAVKFRAAALEDASTLAYVQVRGWHDTYKGIIKDEVLAKFTHAGQLEMWQKIIPKHPGFVAVMQNEADEIIGFVTGGKNRTDELKCDGEIYALYLLKEYHGLGIGARLFLHGIERLTEKGYKSFCLWVLKDNPTVRFYHKFKPDMELSVIKDVLSEENDELGLGWSDMKSVLG